MAIKLKIDLADVLEKNEKNIELRRRLTPFINQRFIKSEYGKRAADRIRERTSKGKDKKSK